MKRFKQCFVIIAATLFLFGLAVNSWAAEGKINVNTASIEQLETLPGVGPTIAERIVDYREGKSEGFTSVDQLTEVKGIGPKTLAGFKDMVTIGEANE